MSKKQVHVVPAGATRWKVRTTGSSKASTVTQHKEDAVDRAREIARNQSAELVIHRKDGTIQDKDSYGNDPYPPRDRVR
jgi:uncharacterized protein YdaT